MDLRKNLLKQQLQREIEIAKKLESIGKIKEASIHYMRASNIYRKLAYIEPRKDAEKFFNNASQYEKYGNKARKEEVDENVNSMLVNEKPTITWNDIGNLEEAKQIIKESVIIPLIKEKPSFVKVSKSILLYGPPGTGKTLLAKAACNMLNANFFEAKASNMLSKYFGETNKLIQNLFSKAREMQPSIIFIDEIDSIAISRSKDLSEAGRRALTQLLIEIEGFESREEDKIIVIAATNKPWDIDDAMLSRFQRKIYVPLPNLNARISIFEIHLKGVVLEDITLKELAKMTENYSGRDIANICREAIMHMIREQNPELSNIDASAINNYKLKYRMLCKKDFNYAILKIRPICDKNMLERYGEWEHSFGV